MFCGRCGAQTVADDAFCRRCGAAVAATAGRAAGAPAQPGAAPGQPTTAGWTQPPPTPPRAYGTGAPPAARRTEGTAIGSMALGIAGLVVFPFIPSIIAIILGNQAKARIRSDRSLDGEGLATAGQVMGWIGVVWGFVLIALISSLFGAADSVVQDSVPFP